MYPFKGLPRPTIEWFRRNPLIPWSGVLAFVKDFDHLFVAVNEEMAYLAGKKPLDMIGLSDADMPWAESAHIYTGYEDDVLAGEHYSIIELLPGTVQYRLFTTKIIIYDEAGQPAGTQATANIFGGNIVNRIQNSARTVISRSLNEYSGFGLTDAETRVLYLILLGHTRQGIAAILGIAPPTYDNYFQAILKAFGAKNRDHLVIICRENYLHAIFPAMAFFGFDIQPAR